jgi:hypothetical protein
MALKAGVDPPVVAPSLEVDSGWTVADKDKLRRRRGGRRKGAVVASVVGSRGGEERQIGVDGVEEEKEVLFPADPADVEDDGSLGQWWQSGGKVRGWSFGERSVRGWIRQREERGRGRRGEREKFWRARRRDKSSSKGETRFRRRRRWRRRRHLCVVHLCLCISPLLPFGLVFQRLVVDAPSSAHRARPPVWVEVPQIDASRPDSGVIEVMRGEHVDRRLRGAEVEATSGCAKEGRGKEKEEKSGSGFEAGTSRQVKGQGREMYFE